MALKNRPSTVLFFVQDVSTGLGVTGLVSSNFTSIKLAQDNVLSAELLGTVNISGYGGGYYAFPATAAMMNYGCVVPIPILPGNYQGYGAPIYTEQGYLIGLSGQITSENSIIRADISGIFDKELLELNSIPAASPTLSQALMLPYMELRNERTQEDPLTSGHYKIKNNAGFVIGSGFVKIENNVFVKGKLEFNG